MKSSRQDILGSAVDTEQMPLVLSEMTREEPRGHETNGTETCTRSLAQKTFLFEGGLALLIASAVGNGSNYLFMMFLARQLGTENFGLYALGLTIFNILLFIAIAGVDTGTIKFVSEYLAQGRPEAARQAIMTAMSVVMGLGVIAALGLLLVADPLFGQLYGKPGLTTVLTWFALTLPFAMVGNLLLSALQAVRIVRYTACIKYLWEPVGKWMLAGLALYAGFGLAGVLGSILLTFAVSTLLLLWAVHVRLGGLSSQRFGTVHRDDVRRFRAYCLPLLVSNIFGIIAPRADVMILGYWVGMQDVGTYLVAFQTAAIPALVLGAFDVAFPPIMSEAWVRRDHTLLRDSYHAVHRLSLIVTMPICVVLVVFSKDILSLFGQAFEGGSVALMILAIGHLVNSATGGTNSVLLMTGESRRVATNTIAYGVSLIGLTAALIPLWGMTGAAVAAASSLVLVNVVRVLQVHRLQGVWPWTRATIKPVAAGVIAGVFFVLVKPYMALAYFPALALCGCLVYAASLAILKFESDDERVFLATLLRLKLVPRWVMQRMA